jgi:hypothetical protein
MRAFFSGGCSSVGRVPDCDSGCRGFEPHQSPQEFHVKTLVLQCISGVFSFMPSMCNWGDSGYFRN